MRSVEYFERGEGNIEIDSGIKTVPFSTDEQA